MAINYLDLIGEFYPDTQVYTAGDPTDYASIVWIDPVVTQADLDVTYLTKIKTEKIILFSETARDEVVDGFNSSALGFVHLYDSEPEDQLNLIGATATEGDVYFSCYPSAQGYQVTNLGGAVVGTDATGLANNTTTYNCEVQIDGASTYLSVAGQDVQTYDALIAELNLDADFSAVAVAALVDGNIKITSNAYGSTSTVNIVDVNLCSSFTQYVGYDTAVVGLDPLENAKDFKLHTHAELILVLNDGKDVKLTILQKFAVKKAQILAAANEAAVIAIVW